MADSQSTSPAWGSGVRPAPNSQAPAAGASAQQKGDGFTPVTRKSSRRNGQQGRQFDSEALSNTRGHEELPDRRDDQDRRLKANSFAPLAEDGSSLEEEEPTLEESMDPLSLNEQQGTQSASQDQAMNLPFTGEDDLDIMAGDDVADKQKVSKLDKKALRKAARKAEREKQKAQATATDNVSKHAYPVKEVDVTDLEPGCAYEESNMLSYMYPAKSPMGDDLTIVHKRYDKCPDIARFNKGNAVGNPGGRVSAYVVAYFDDESFFTGHLGPYSDPSAQDAQKKAAPKRPADGGSKEGQADSKSRCGVKYRASSQLPAVLLEVNVADDGEEEEKLAYLHFFSNCMQVKYEQVESDTSGRYHPRDVGFRMTHQKQVDNGIANDVMDKKLKDDVTFRKWLSSQQVHKTSITQWQRDDSLQGLYLPDRESPVNCKRTEVVISGEGLDQVGGLDVLLQRYEAGQLDRLNAGQRLICMIADGATVDIYEKMTPGKAAYRDELGLFMRGAFSAAASWGPFWQYELQLRKDGWTLNDANVDYSDLKPPRLLVKTVLVGYDPANNGRQIPGTVRPLTWQGMTLPAEWPTIGSHAFIMKLGEYREMQRRKTVLEQGLARPGVKLTATFTRRGADPKAYTVDIKIPQLQTADGRLIDLPKILPDEGERFGLIVKGPNDGKYKGKVRDSLTKKDDVQLHGEIVHAGQFKDKDAYVELRENDPYEVTLELEVNSIPGNRKIWAIQDLARGHRRSKGIDLSAAFFGVRPRTDQGHLAFWQSQRVNFQATVDGVLARKDKDGNLVHRLDDSQYEAILGWFTKKKGGLLMNGPPGTGKTSTLIALIDILTALNLKVAVTAPGNGQVDNCAEGVKMRGIAKGRMIRSRNAYYKIGVLHEYLQDGDVEMTGTLETDSKIDGDAAAGKIVADRLKQLRDGPGDIAKSADKYIKLIAACKAALDRNDRAAVEKLADNKARLESELYPEVFRYIDLWFVTTNSAGHGVLARYAKPHVVIIEEAGISSGASDAVPAASFMESSLMVCWAGDYKQIKPLCTSKEANEAQEEMEVSLFQRLADRTKTKDRKVFDAASYTLKYCYRSHPDIAMPIAEVIYPNEGLQPAECTKVITPKQVAIQQFMQHTFKGTFPGQFRLAVDVSGLTIKDENYNNTTSRWNEGEIIRIVQFVQALLAWQPQPVAEPVEAIKAGDIGISSPYGAQCQVLRQRLREVGISASAAADKSSDDAVVVDTIQVMTASVIQGKQFPVHVISFVKRTPENIKDCGFVSEEGQLCVQMTRAEKFQISFGNFRAWDEAQLHKMDSSSLRAKFYAVVKGLADRKQIMATEDFDAAMIGQPRDVPSYSVRKRADDRDKFNRGGKNPQTPQHDGSFGGGRGGRGGQGGGRGGQGGGRGGQSGGQGGSARPRPAKQARTS